MSGFADETSAAVKRGGAMQVCIPSLRHWLSVFSISIFVLALAGCGDAAEPTATATRRVTATSTPEVAVPASTAAPTAELPPTITPPVLPSATPQPVRQSTSTAAPTATPTLTPTPRPTRAVPPTPDLQAMATQYPELGAILNNPEVAAIYKELLGAYQQNGQQGAMAVARQRGVLSPEGDILATLQLGSADTAATVTQLQGLGIKVLNTQDNMINIAVPAALLLQGAQYPGEILNQLSGLQNVVGVRPPGR